MKMKKLKKIKLISLNKNYQRIKKHNISVIEKSKEDRKEFISHLSYKPLHPRYPFDRSSITIEKLSKVNNISLLLNNNIKNIILKFRENKLKESESRRPILYKSKSYTTLKEEKDSNFLLLRAMLRKDAFQIENILNRNKLNNKRINKKIRLKKIIHIKLR